MSCAACGNGASKFCPQTGLPHKLSCPLCGLSTPFCGVTGKPHSPAAVPNAAVAADLKQQAAEEAIAYAVSSSKARERSLVLTADQRQKLESMSADGFGIFGPGNPALVKVQATAKGQKPPPDEPVGHRLDMPDEVMEKLVATLRSPLHGGKPVQSGPAWMRRVRPALKAISIVMGLLVCLAVVQVIVSGFRNVSKSSPVVAPV